ncbi:GspH/FimT family pseudopilin [Thalassolituus sp. LLYu03]|uniref:GspH/FimT family pseudopilin n=1 Tax=Thalassolituus sp. LLYu03 TaxID=3421656 RepID=UPI003D296F73
MHKDTIRAFSITELLITTALIAIIVQIGMPAMTNLTDKMKSNNELSSLHILIAQARQAAILRNTTTTICPLIDNSCTDNWNNTLALFTDENRNNRLDADETLLGHINAAPANVMRTFTGSTIGFDARGFSGFRTGSLGYCRTGTSTYSGSFIISRVGRIRRGSDSNGDGIAETASNKNVRCP